MRCVGKPGALLAADLDAVDANAFMLNSAAWILLTNEIEAERDPELALGYAKRACALCEKEAPDRLWAPLDTLALAQHETGDTAAAIETQRRVLSLMPQVPSGEGDSRSVASAG